MIDESDPSKNRPHVRGCCCTREVRRNRGHIRDREDRAPSVHIFPQEGKPEEIRAA